MKCHIMQHSFRVYTLAKTKLIFTERYVFFWQIITCNPSIYLMEYSKTCLKRPLTPKKTKNWFSRLITGLPRSGKKFWKMKNFPCQGKVRELHFQSGKFKKNEKSHGKVREFQNFPKKMLVNSSFVRLLDFNNRSLKIIIQEFSMDDRL